MFSIPVSLFQLLFPLDLFGLCVCFFPSEGHRMLSREFVFCLFIIDVAKCNLCKVKLQANVVFGLLLKRMWSVEWLQGPLLFLWLTLHLMLAFWADLCGSVVEANLSGFWLPALLSLFGGSVQVYDVSNYYIFSPLSYITNILLCEFEYYYDNLFVHACNEALNYGYLVQHSCNFHFVPWQESGRSAIQVRRRGNKSWRWTTSMTHAYPALIVIMKNNIIIYFLNPFFVVFFRLSRKKLKLWRLSSRRRLFHFLISRKNWSRKRYYVVKSSASPPWKQFKIYVHTLKPAHKRCSYKYNILRLYGCIWTFVLRVGAKIVRFDTNFWCYFPL